MARVIDPYENVMADINCQLHDPNGTPTHDMIVTAVANEMYRWLGVDMVLEGYAWAQWICNKGYSGVKEIMEKTLEKVELTFAVYPDNKSGKELLMEKYTQLFSK